MGNTANQIKRTLEIDGTIAAAIVDSESGMTLAAAGGNPSFDIEVAAAANTNVVQAKLKAMSALRLAAVAPPRLLDPRSTERPCEAPASALEPVPGVIHAPPPPDARPPGDSSHGLSDMSEQSYDIVPLAPGPPAPVDDVSRAAPAPADPEPAADPPPVRPGAQVPPGHVWPAPAGRTVLEQIAGEPLAPVARRNGHVSETMSFQAGGFRLRTRPEWRFVEREHGRAALIDHVRRVARLGPLLPTGIAVALAADDDDGAALWHIVPDLPSLGAELDAAPAAERPRHLARLAAAYATALRLVAREDVGLELDPHAFAEQDGHYVYLGDRLHDPGRAPDLAQALLAPLSELAAHEGLVDVYLEAIEQALAATLTREDVAALGLESHLAAAADPARDPRTHSAMMRVRASLDRCP